MQNNSKETIQIKKSISDYSLEIKNENDSPVKTQDNPHGFIFKGWRSGKRFLEIPSEEKSYKMFVLTDTHDFSKIGDYSVSLKRLIFNTSKSKDKKEIKSNEINIKIIGN